MSDECNSAHATLVMVRHGETEGESSIRYHGRTDVRLSELGRSQMRAARVELAARMKGTGFARVFSSPMSRAVEGARLITGADGAEIVKIEEFAEVHFGLFEGLTAEEIRERYPDEFARWRTHPLAPDYTYPGGENRRAFAERVSRGLHRMLAAWPGEIANGGCVLMVAHRGVIRTTAETLAGVEPTVELGSLQILERHGDRWHPGALDVTPRLDR